MSLILFPVIFSYKRCQSFLQQKETDSRELASFSGAVLKSHTRRKQGICVHPTSISFSDTGGFLHPPVPGNGGAHGFCDSVRAPHTGQVSPQGVSGWGLLHPAEIKRKNSLISLNNFMFGLRNGCPDSALCQCGIREIVSDVRVLLARGEIREFVRTE